MLTRWRSDNPTSSSRVPLGVSIKTVEKHRANLMRKLTLHNTAAVTRFAIRHGMVTANDLDGATS